MPEGLVGYAITLNGKALVETEAYQAKDGVPAKTPLLIKGAKNTYTLAEATETKSLMGQNDLKGAATDDEIKAADGKKLYVYANGAKGYGFYWPMGTQGEKVSNIKGKCYLEADAAAQVQAFFLNLSNPTAIETLDVQAENETIYDLSGRRVRQAGRGLYIINGKKVVR